MEIPSQRLLQLSPEEEKKFKQQQLQKYEKQKQETFRYLEEKRKKSKLPTGMLGKMAVA